MATIKKKYNSNNESLSKEQLTLNIPDNAQGIILSIDSDNIDSNESLVNYDGHNPINTSGRIDLYRDILEDEKSRTKFIKEIVSQCRRAYEYRSYIHYLKENVDMTGCTFLKRIPDEIINKVGLEIHHHPLSLFDIVSIILADSIIKADDTHTVERFSSITIVHKTLLEHWRNRVGLVPLTTTLHQMAHDGQLFIHPYSIFGNWIEFLNIYSETILKTDWLAHISEKMNAILNMWKCTDINMAKSNEKLQIGLLYDNSILGVENIFIEKK